MDPAASSEKQLDHEDGPYILRPLLEAVPLCTDGSAEDVKINCVEYYGKSVTLSVGHQASEVLHFVQMPPDPGEPSGSPVYIPASRLSPVSLDSFSRPSAAGPGVQEIVLLPQISKACVLCNSTAAFYSLPELSPVSGISVVKNCSWIGGLDLNIRPSSATPKDATILLSLKSKIQIVRLADKVLEAPPVAVVTDKPLPAAPGDEDTFAANETGHGKPLAYTTLNPHIVSPNAEEFLLVIGTRKADPGVGMFVSLDGEPTRATIQFDKYPEYVAIDGINSGLNAPQMRPDEQDDGHVIATFCKDFGSGPRYGMEIQHLNAGNEVNPEKYWLEAKPAYQERPYGLKTLLGGGHVRLDEIVSKLSQKKFYPFPGYRDPGHLETPTSPPKKSESRTATSTERLPRKKESSDGEDFQDDESQPQGWEAARNREGEEFAGRLANFNARLAVWNGNRIWWALPNPLIIQLDTRLDMACSFGDEMHIDRLRVISVLKLIRGRDARTELDHMTLDYLKQKAGLLLLVDSLSSTRTNQSTRDSELKELEQVLSDSKLDPRVALFLFQGMRDDVIEGSCGIWVYSGIKKVAETIVCRIDSEQSTTFGDIDLCVMHFLRRFLLGWRKMKGFGSVPDEKEVFRTIDACLLIVLLELEQRSSKESADGDMVRSELNDLVDGGVDCFDRAVDILVSYRRLFVLSRLYQSRKMSSDVLLTWKRMLEGEEDSMHEFRDGEQRMREYLKKIGSRALVEEYGVWLANRNPRLGVQVFAEDEGKVPPFEPAKAVATLRSEAPSAVKYYLEHLVFDKGLTSYVHELLEYYLDLVLGDLESSAAHREAVMAGYEAYRALQTPKPTYPHFLTENAPRECDDDDDVWNSRLRLLQLLGGAHVYDTTVIAERVRSLPGELLVPETVILAGLQHRHDEALHLLVHRLGDYDTAVSYCLCGGAGIYAPHGASRRRDAAPEPEQQRRLFQQVLQEFLRIADASDRVEQTCALLERFGEWFRAEDVLRLVPDTWSVDVLAGFLLGALRRLVRERNESAVRKALNGAENLRVSYDLVVGTEQQRGPRKH
ncbi:hypothetical protein UVI_02025730 [Ustilaginoidea virens]|uniref:CNH domain-containing protein n=1 Tax=Ustilaginoidea virens TaxID=1159556 RepID=A0A1B5KTK3_USTVR|nr:hypothetical protein UVI_02025730 [Ustilaginoidea virens]